MAEQNQSALNFNNAQNKNNIPHTYSCQLCTSFLKDSVQLICGHRFCRSCIHIENQCIVICVRCNSETPRDKIIFDQIFQDDVNVSLNNIIPCEKNDTINPHCEKILVEHNFEPCSRTEQHLNMDTEQISSEKQSENILPKVSLDIMPNIEHSMLNNDQIETIDSIQNSIQSLTDDVQQLNSQLHQSESLFQSVSADFLKLNIAIQEKNSVLNDLVSDQETCLKNYTSLILSMNDLQSTSYDGTFLWKITDVHKKMDEAQSGKQTSIFSPPFYSSPYGYKMCVRLYLNGDDNTYGTHMSVFFVLMRGEYDAILQFPFTFKVTFFLYDQTTDRRHIIDSFQPDPNSNSFHRPALSMNIASGIPKFCPISTIQQKHNGYIKNDTMFLKVVVHFEDILKVTPDVCTGV